MEKRLNSLGQILVLFNEKDVTLDRHIKRLMVETPLLARILKETVEECRKMELEEIEKCFTKEGVIVAESGSEEASKCLKALELSQESLTADGEHVIFDILTAISLPGEEPIKIFINLEFQKDDHPGYDIPTRGWFHCARILSSQLGREFTNHPDDKDKYGNMKKVYSIWICSNSAEIRANSVDRYRIERKTIIGKNSDAPRYDLMSVVVINIGNKRNPRDTDSKMLLILNALFDRKLSKEEKLKKLEEYGMPVTQEVEEEVSDMCTYTSEVEKATEISTYVKLINKKKLSISDAIEETKMTEKEFLAAVKTYGFELK